MRRLSSAHFYLFTLLILALAIVLTQSAQAQSRVPLHEFTGGQDGGYPYAGLTLDRAGNLYGTAALGGTYERGVVFRIIHKSGGWLFNPLYTFTGGDDGSVPYSRVVFGPDGSLFGTTQGGGGNGCLGGGCGTVFNLKPPPHAPPQVLTPFTETVLYRFGGGNDGASPTYGDLLFDSSGNIYGTTEHGGGKGCLPDGCGTVFQLRPSAGGQWAETLLYVFSGGSDGRFPYGGVVNKVGSLYGTVAYDGAYACGAVFELIPSGPNWTKITLYDFNPNLGDGCNPQGGLIFDSAGNLYGTTVNGGYQGGGTVFELTPSGGGWTETVLYSFISGGGGGPTGALALDGAGNLYGTTWASGVYLLGNVFKLTPSGGGWQYTSLYDFTGHADGANSYGAVTVDAGGNIYGTVLNGGTHSEGVAFEIVP